MPATAQHLKDAERTCAKNPVLPPRPLLSVPGQLQLGEKEQGASREDAEVILYSQRGRTGYQLWSVTALRGDWILFT
jgi:hypothetical protein